MVDELQKSKVFDYIPGRYHKTSRHMLTPINYSPGYKGIKKRFQIASNSETFYTKYEHKKIFFWLLYTQITLVLLCIFVDDIQYCGAVIK